jgi:N utilization substance protein B
VTGHRTQAREAALQILYMWEVGGTQPVAAVEAFFQEHEPEATEPVTAFATRLALGTMADIEGLDLVIERHARHWRIERLAVIDRLILRLAIWEMRHEAGTPPAVVINEALELARKFSSDESVRFVNGVLDAVRRQDAVAGDEPDGTRTHDSTQTD